MCVTVFKYFLRNFSETTQRSKLQLILAMTFIFCTHFIENSQLTTILYIFHLSQHSACPSHALITMVSILAVGLSVRLLCPDFSDPSSLTERTSDSQHLGTSNDTTSVAKHRTLKSQLD